MFAGLLFSLLLSISCVSCQRNAKDFEYICAQLVHRTYLNDNGTVCEFEFRERMVTEFGQVAHVYTNNDQVVFAFKGINRMDNDTALAAHFPLVSIVPGSRAQVHQGLRAWSLQFLYLVDRYTTKYRSISMCGHSAGGAVSYILTGFLVSADDEFRKRIDNVVTFASPKPGDPVFADYWKKVVRPKLNIDSRYVMFRKSFPLITYYDFVTHLPLYPYVHANNDESNIECLPETGRRCSLLDLHHMRFYLNSLQTQSPSICTGKNE